MLMPALLIRMCSALPKRSAIKRRNALDLVLVRDIGHEDIGPAARVANFLCDVVQLLLLARDERDTRAGSGERDGHRFAKSLAGAGDQRGSAV